MNVAPRTLLIAMAVLLFLIGAGVVWAASELHYVGCVKAVEARTLVGPGHESVGWRDPSGEQVRAAAVSGCSRLP